MPTHCAVPFCTYQSKDNYRKRALFCVRRPEFARTPEDKEHRARLTNFLLSTRGNLRGMLHKETAAICSNHFLPEDIVTTKGGMHRLKLGAVPFLNLTKPVQSTSSNTLRVANQSPGEKLEKGSRKELRTGAIPTCILTVEDEDENKPKCHIERDHKEAELPKIRNGRVVLSGSYKLLNSRCVAVGCNKKPHKKTRSDSEGSDDSESEAKRKQPRSFHKFPSDPLLFRQWIKNIRRKDWFPNRFSKICSDHFDEKYIIRTYTPCSRLTKDAVPTRFKALRKRHRTRPEEDKQYEEQ